MPDTLIRPAVLAGIPGVFAAFTTRHFADPDRTAAEAAARSLGAEEGFHDLASTAQVHGGRVATVDTGGTVPDHDGLVTATPGLLLAVVAADCALVLLADTEAGVVGACHSGWRGAVAGIAGETVLRMAELGADPERMRAYVGPCISAEAFEVGEEVAEHFDDAFVVRRPEWPRPHVDLRAAVAAQLREAGVPVAQTEVSEACTVYEPERFYSYRGEDGTQGRLLGLIGLRG
jgi:polyphenol oxidase